MSVNVNVNVNVSCTQLRSLFMSLNRWSAEMVKYIKGADIRPIIAFGVTENPAKKFNLKYITLDPIVR